MLYPCDAITLPFITPPASGVVLLTATSTNRTFFNFLDTNYANGDAYITDDSNALVLADASAVLRQDNRFTSYKSKGRIVSHNSAPSGNSSGQIVYVERDINATATIACEGKPAVYNGFTHGEVISGTFLFFIFMTLSYILFRLIFKPIKIKN